VTLHTLRRTPEHLYPQHSTPSKEHCSLPQPLPEHYYRSTVLYANKFGRYNVRQCVERAPSDQLCFTLLQHYRDTARFHQAHPLHPQHATSLPPPTNRNLAHLRNTARLPKPDTTATLPLLEHLYLLSSTLTLTLIHTRYPLPLPEHYTPLPAIKLATILGTLYTTRSCSVRYRNTARCHPHPSGTVRTLLLLCPLPVTRYPLPNTAIALPSTVIATKYLCPLPEHYLLPPSFILNRYSGTFSRY